MQREVSMDFSFLLHPTETISNAFWWLNAVPIYALQSGEWSLVGGIDTALAALPPGELWPRVQASADFGKAMLRFNAGDYEGAKIILEDIDPNLIGFGWYCVAELTRLIGDDERAAELFEFGIEHHAKLNVLIGWIYLSLARLTSQSGPCHDEAESASWLQKAKDSANGFDLELLKHRIIEFETESKVSGNAGAGTRSANPAGLTVREIEILGEIVDGKTDAEIAETLFISTKTVSNHVGNILRKTESSNRTEAAKFATQNGLLNESE
jgi:DNA-binding CsgD family transcriptional regulator